MDAIEHLVIEKVSGRIVYAVASFGGFLGLGERLHTIRRRTSGAKWRPISTEFVPR